MALQGAAKRLYMKRYMARRRLETKALAWQEQLRQERKLLKKALRRVALAEKWASEHPEERIDECLLSLGWQWNQVMEEEKKKNSKSVGVRVPTRFESVP